MLTTEEEERPQQLRRELVVLLHLTADRMPALSRVQGWHEAFRPLEEVRSRLEGVSVEHAALRIAAPPFLRSERLRGLVASCLKRLLGESVTFSVRILGELGDTLQAAFELEEAWLEQGAAPGRAVLCFTDEEAVESITLLLSELKGELERKRVKEVVEAFPLNHYDTLCRWEGEEAEMVDGSAAFVAQAYGSLTQTAVSTTGRKLGEAETLLQFLGT